MKSNHLHLVREAEPEEKPEYHVWPVPCPDCEAIVYLIHLDLPPEDPD